MILIENCKVYGWEPAIRGMRNPMNSWDKSDTKFASDGSLEGGLGENDYKLMSRLADAGQVHGKYLRMITVTMDITAPLYWWKEADTYKIGTVTNSCSTMHKIHTKEFTTDDFSHEHLISWDDSEALVPLCEEEETKLTVYISAEGVFKNTIFLLNFYREKFLETKDKKYWWQMVQLLPSSYNQRRTIQLNYAVLKNIYEYRKDHKLDEWRDFCDWIKRLPYSEFITGEY